MRIVITVCWFLVFGMFFPATGLGGIVIDGIPDETQWAGAKSFRDFVVIDPLTLGTPRLATEAKILSLPEGLAVAFICKHPPEVPRTRTQTLLDASRFDSDAVSFIIDFDGSGNIAYEFSVSITGSYRDGTITDETRFSYDWDGVWQQAVHETEEEWTVEMLIPWSIAAMRDGDSDTRIVGVSFQRELDTRNETFAYPAASPERSRFVSDLAPVEVARHSSREFNLWPYVTVVGDLVEEKITAKAGIDLFWKHNGNLQVAGTLNPDFGHVESDDLVINFSAIETLYSEKRPFFTENQAIFKLGAPRSGNLIYTRRIGGPGDRDGTPSDIDGAVKVIGSRGRIDYGFMGAWEADAEGRDYYAGRLVLPLENYSVGALTTYTNRPFLERTGLVNAVDYDIQLGEAIRWEGKFLGSRVEAPEDRVTGYGGYSSFMYNPSERWKYQALLTKYSDDLDISDMGYIARTDLEELYLSGEWRRTGFGEASRAASVTWRLTAIMSRNTAGERLPAAFTLNRSEKLRSGAELGARIDLESPGYDDLVSRGNGSVYLNERWNGTVSYSTQRKGAWRRQLSLQLFQEGIDDWALGMNANATWYPLDSLTVDMTVNPQWSRDWLIWMHDDLLASFNKRQLRGDLQFTWFPAASHEFRLKSQWLAVKADSAQGYRIGPDGRLAASGGRVEDFATTKFGLQFRYRYEIAPLSDFYIVYSRGGTDTEEATSESTLELFRSSTSLRDSDQFLVKLRYRF